MRSKYSNFSFPLFSGDILSWNLSRKSKPKWRLFGEHSRIVFNMCHHPANDVMISVSMDRQVLKILENNCANSFYSFS